MKISIIMPEIVRSPSGGHKVIYEYCNRLVNEGHIVSLYFFPGPIFKKYHIIEPIRLIMVKFYGESIGPRAWFNLDKRVQVNVIKQNDTIDDGDIVIATAINTATFVNKLPQSKGKKFYFIQGFENWNNSNEEVYETYRLGMTNIAVSNWLKEIVEQQSEKKCYLISNGIDTNVFYNKGIAREKHSVVFQYRKDVCKGGQYAFEVIKRLPDKYSDLKVEIISSEKITCELPEYCTYHFNISAEEVAEINNRNQVFMCTSIEEGYGLPGLEAMATGMALVITDYLGAKEYAINGYNALVSPTKDVTEMTENIVRLFEDEQLRLSIIQGGLDTAKNKSINNTSELLKNLLFNES